LRCRVGIPHALEGRQRLLDSFVARFELEVPDTRKVVAYDIILAFCHGFLELIHATRTRTIPVHLAESKSRQCSFLTALRVYVSALEPSSPEIYSEAERMSVAASLSAPRVHA
jgi:hypothetical protein